MTPNTICSSDSDTVDLPKSNKGVHNIKEGDNVLIMASIENLIEIFENFGALCPRCGSSSIEYKPTYQDGIRFFLTLVCNECEKCASVGHYQNLQILRWFYILSLMA